MKGTNVVNLYHYTINTKHLKISLRKEINPATMENMGEFLDKMLSSGRPTPSDVPVSLYELIPLNEFKNYSVRFAHHSKTNAEAQVEFFVHDELAARFFLINNPRALWQFCKTIDLPRPKRPELPACFTHLETDRIPANVSLWLGDFERCLAWAWFERVKH